MPQAMMGRKWHLIQVILTILTVALWFPSFILQDWYCRTKSHHANFQDGQIYSLDCHEYVVWVNNIQYHRLNRLRWGGLICAAIVVTIEIVKKLKNS
jgi:hypothetical protein